MRTRAIPERFRGAFTTRRYTNPRLPLPYLYLPSVRPLQMVIISLVVIAVDTVSRWLCSKSSVVSSNQACGFSSATVHVDSSPSVESGRIQETPRPHMKQPAITVISGVSVSKGARDKLYHGFPPPPPRPLSSGI